MKKGESKRKSGFTIIEVSLVLAIAGLIFLMIFVALPALQRSTRDTQRREDMMDLANAIKKYQSNNRGALPIGDDWSEPLSDYLSDNFSDPSDDRVYKLVVGECDKNKTKERGDECDDELQYKGETFPHDYKVGIVKGATCDGETVVKTANPRNVAVVYKLEVGTYCGSI